MQSHASNRHQALDAQTAMPSASQADVLERMHKLATTIDAISSRSSHASLVEGLTISRIDGPDDHALTARKLSLVLVAQGLGCVIADHHASRLLTGSGFILHPGDEVDVPHRSVFAVRPLLAIMIELDLEIIMDLLADAPSYFGIDRPQATFHSIVPDVRIIDPVERLLNLIDDAEDATILAPLHLRELTWRLLRSSFLSEIDSFIRSKRQLSRIAMVLEWMKSNFASAVTVSGLAKQANMSPASFNRHFKTVTGTSPLQYLKVLRLTDARRRISQAQGICAAAFDAGYDSLSQFNRDYRRSFGCSPTQHLLLANSGK